MMILVVGRPDSGKSKRAEDLALELSGGGRKLYIATMIPFGEEGKERVAKHRKLREGKEFETVECPVDLRSICGLKTETGAVAGDILPESTCLLECVSNLVGNEMHLEERLCREESEVAGLVVEEILWLKDNTKDLVVVTNEFEKEEGFDEDTLRYIDITSLVNARLKEAADRVVEI